MSTTHRLERAAALALSLGLCLCLSPPVARALPDLVVSQIDIVPSNPVPGDQIRIRALVTNNGSAIGFYTTTRFWRNNAFLCDLGVGPMYAGASQWTSYYTVGSLPSGTHVFQACADALNQATEGNESNNCRTRNVTLPAGAPNLIITEIQLQPAYPQPGEAVQARALVRNSGYSTAPASATRIFVDSAPKADLATGAINPGATVATAWGGIGAYAAGSYTVRACADALGQVTEGNETDNCTQTSLSVGADLVVTAIEWNPPNPVFGQTVFIRAQIKNQGACAAPGSNAQLWVDGRSMCYAGVAALPPQASTWTGWCSAGVLGPGNHMGQACADATNLVAELYENNNCRTGSVYVSGGAADLVVVEIEWTPAQPPPGQIVQLRALVRNQGTADAGGSTVRFKVDGAVKCDLQVGGLWAGTEAWVGPCGIGSLSAGTHPVEVCADALGQVAESNETNNCRSEQMVVGPAPPPGVPQPSAAGGTAQVVPGEETSARATPAIPQLLSAPNPFSGRTRIAYGVPERATIRLEIHAVDGRLVRTLERGDLSAGWHEAVWDGNDGAGRPVPAGVYFARLSVSGARSILQRMILTR